VLAVLDRRAEGPVSGQKVTRCVTNRQEVRVLLVEPAKHLQIRGIVTASEVRLQFLGEVLDDSFTIRSLDVSVLLLFHDFPPDQPVGGDLGAVHGTNSRGAGRLQDLSDALVQGDIALSGLSGHRLVCHMTSPGVGKRGKMHTGHAVWRVSERAIVCKET
jgi:hypothetical protein